MKDQSKGRVIVTSSRNLMALAIARSLGMRDIEIIGADCIETTFLRMSKYVQYNEVYTNYMDDEDKFLDDLEEIVKKYQPDDNRPYLLFPVFTETRLIIGHAERLSPYIKVAAPSIDGINRIFPKNVFAKTAQKYNVSIPVTFFPKKKKDVENIPQKIGFPVLIKPYNDSGGKGIKKIHDMEGLKEAFDINVQNYSQPPLVQEILDGEDYCFTAILKEGELKASLAYKNLHSFPADAGSGVVRLTVDETPFTEEAKKLLHPMRWTGTAQIDFMWNGKNDQQPRMIELNPRFWAGLYQAIHSGVDYPWLNYLLFSGQQLPEVPPPARGVKTKIPAVWILSLIQESVQVSKSLKDIKNTAQTAIEEFSKKNNLADALKQIFNDDRNTVHAPFNSKKFKSGWQEARNAENEIFSNTDPDAAKGMIYSLSYLAKYKKFPPEIGL